MLEEHCCATLVWPEWRPILPVAHRSTTCLWLVVVIGWHQNYWLANHWGNRVTFIHSAWPLTRWAWFLEVGRILGSRWTQQIHQIYTNEVPLGHVSPGDLRELVVHQNVRPERPDNNEAPQLTNEVWRLIERCWAGRAVERPNADVIHSILANKAKEVRLEEISPDDIVIACVFFGLHGRGYY